MTRTMTVTKRQPSVQNQITFQNKPLVTCKYNLLGNVNKHFSGNYYILPELFDKMILTICT